MPSSPIVRPSQVPAFAISTAPGLPSEESQQSTAVVPSVGGISGLVHHVAARSDSPPSIAETICHGGTAHREGFEIKTTLLYSVDFVAVVLVESFPSPFTSA